MILSIDILLSVKDLEILFRLSAESIVNCRSRPLHPVSEADITRL